MPRSGSWEQRVVASLIASKQSGRYTHDDAWRMALQSDPPRPSDMATSNGTLFDVSTGELEVSLVDAMYGYTADAWYGRRPGLRAFTLDMLAAADQTRPALVAGHVRAAA